MPNRLLALAGAAALVLPGCVAHRHTIGLGPTGQGVASARQYYCFFGLLQFNDVSVQRMAQELTSYSVETEFSVVDALLLPLLLPFTFTSRTVTVRT